MNRTWTGALALSAALLTACGGGDGGAVVPPQPPSANGDVPASALASGQAYAGFVGAQAADDQRQPLALGDMTPPASDTEAPIVVP